MHQVLFHIFSIPVYGYGLMLVLGFLAATRLARFLARRKGLDGELFVNAAIIGLVAGVIGARLCHVLENISEFTRADRSVGQNLWAMVNLSSGGLTFYGGFLLAFVVLVRYARWKKIPLRLGMDIVAPCVMVGLGFGRIGCYMNGCCYGAETPHCTVTFPYKSPAYLEQLQKAEAAKDIEQIRWLTEHEHARPVLPAQLFSSFNAFLLAGLLLAYFTLPHATGRVFALMLMLKGLTRFILEMLRVEPAVLGPMSISQVISIGLMGLGVGMWLYFGATAEKQTPAPALAAA